MLGGHSGLDPPLPISNRAVKRTSANDSMLFACESRSPPSYSYTTIVKMVNKKVSLIQISGGFFMPTVLISPSNKHEVKNKNEVTGGVGNGAW